MVRNTSRDDTRKLHFCGPFSVNKTKPCPNILKHGGGSIVLRWKRDSSTSENEGGGLDLGIPTQTTTNLSSKFDPKNGWMNVLERPLQNSDLSLTKLHRFCQEERGKKLIVLWEACAVWPAENLMEWIKLRSICLFDHFEMSNGN